MSVVRAAGKSGGLAGEDHELLNNRLGVGPNGEAWHFSKEEHDRLLQNMYYRGAFIDQAALETAHPVDIAGAFAIVFETGTFWYWGGLDLGWQDSHKAGSEIAALPPGGTVGQILAKKSGVDGDAHWIDLLANGVHNDLDGLQGGSPLERYHLSEAGAHKVENVAPDRPYNVSPEADELDVTERPLMQGSAYHHMYGYEMYGYQLQILDGAAVIYDTDAVEAAEGQHQLPAGVLAVGSEYQWRIRYCGTNLVWSLWSVPTAFTTEAVWTNPLVLQPRIIVPGNGSVVNNQTPQLLTTPFDEGSGTTQVPGDFVIAGDAGMTDIIEQGEGLISYLTQTALTRGRQYFARANHKGDDGEGNIATSRWSPRISFVVRQPYRGTRIGLVLLDPVNWIFGRMGADWGPVDTDADYWVTHPAYAMLEATKAQLVGGQAVSSLMRFWIKSGTIQSGPYAGLRGWMIDTEKPSDAELAAGWHLHGAFISQQYGEQDVVYIGRDGIVINGGIATSPEGPVNATYTNPAAAEAAVLALNSDPSDPLKRGWRIMTYTEHEALKLLMMIEHASLNIVNELYNKSGNPYHGVYFYNQASNIVFGTARYGIGKTTIALPGDDMSTRFVFVGRDQVPQAGAPHPANDLIRASDAPAAANLDDYILGAYRPDGGVGAASPDGSRIGFVSSSPTALYSEVLEARGSAQGVVGMIGLKTYQTQSSSSGNATYKLVKRT